MSIAKLEWHFPKSKIAMVFLYVAKVTVSYISFSQTILIVSMCIYTVFVLPGYAYIHSSVEPPLHLIG